MAEEPSRKEETIINKGFGKLRNFYVRIFRKKGLDYHYTVPKGEAPTVIPTFTDLQEEINLEHLGAMNKKMVETEVDWEGKESVEKIMNEMIEYYSKDGENEEGAEIIKTSLGPYTELDAIEREGRFAEKGTKIVRDNITIKKGDDKIKGVFHRPDKEPIYYTDGRGYDEFGTTYSVVFFGYENEVYWNTLISEVNEIIEKCRVWHESRTTDKQKLENLAKNIEFIKSYFEKAIIHLKTKIKNFELNHRDALISSSGVRTIITDKINNIMKKGGSLEKFKLTQEKIFFTHTYHIIKQFAKYKIKADMPKLIDEEKFDEEFNAKTRNVTDIVQIVNIEVELLQKVTLSSQDVEIMVFFDPSKQPYLRLLEDAQIEFNKINLNEKISQLLTLRTELKEINEIMDPLNKRLFELDKRAGRIFDQSFENRINNFLDNKFKLELYKRITEQMKTENPKIDTTKLKKSGEKETLGLIDNIKTNIENLKKGIVESMNKKLKDVSKEKIEELIKIVKLETSNIGQILKTDQSKDPRILEAFENVLNVFKEIKLDKDMAILLKKLIAAYLWILYFSKFSNIKQNILNRMINPLQRKFVIENEISQIRESIRKKKQAEIEKEKYEMYNNYRKPNFEKWDWEQGIGLDENGWPLEVGDGITLFDGTVLEKGVVLSDIYMPKVPNPKSPKRRSVPSIRRVPEEFIGLCDPLDIVTWMYVAYDPYRDDMRDGRYHKNAITVMDRIMSETYSPYLKHVRTVSREEREEGYWKDKKVTQAKVEIKLNDLATSSDLAPSNLPNYIKMTMRPNHLNPAFDVRASRVDKHIGKVYYYDLQDNTEMSINPTITTRGAAMYILYRVIEEAKYFGHAEGKVGALQLLRAIADKTEGYDIGPNLGRWTNSLTKDIFKPGQSGG